MIQRFKCCDNLREQGHKSSCRYHDHAKRKSPAQLALNPAFGLCVDSVRIEKPDAPVGGLAARLKGTLNVTIEAQSYGLKPTDEQKAILTAVLDNDPVLIIEAGAGTGKTATLKMIGQTLPGNGQYTAFNSSLVAESKTKFAGSKVSCNTTHSLAFRAEGSRFAHRLGGNRIKADQLADMLGLDAIVVPFGESKKRLSAGFLASQVLGAVRRFCQSADLEVAVEHFKYLDGLDVPNEDGGRGYANNKKIRNSLLPYAKKAWKDLSSPEGRLPFSHDHYVKVWQLNKPVIAADYVLLDECFPAGTMVQTSQGITPIEYIVATPMKEWSVLSSVDGGETLRYSPVTAAYRTPRKGPLVRIEHAKGILFCTANHPLWIENKGWTPAGLVVGGDSLSCLQQSNTQKAGDLLAILCKKIMEQTKNTRIRSRSAGQDFQTNESSQDGDSKSNGTTGSQSQSISYAQGERGYFLNSRGQRQRANQTSTALISSTGQTTTELAMESRICRLQWKTYQRNSNKLQDRHSISSEENSSRSGRRVSSESKRLRSEKRTGTQGSRVVGVTIYESENPRKSNEDCSRDCQYVYTLSVKAGCYFADEILVKNCQDTAPVMLDVLRQQKCPVILVGDSAQQIYEWRGAVNALAAFPEASRLFLSQSFRFGPAIAEVANAVLSTLEEPTKLRLKGLDSINSKIEAVQDPVAILCRTNAVAVASLLGIIAEGRKGFLIGGGADTIAFVEAAQRLQNGESTGHPDLACFDSWSEVQGYSKMEEGEDLKLMVDIVDAFGAETILSALRGMPAHEKNADVVVSTAHKSKGREWDTVRLAADFPTKSKCTDADRKLLYVAVTRAKIVLDVTSCPFFTGEDSLNIRAIRDKYYDSTASGEGFIPTAPSSPPAPTQFTWTSKDGKWLVRGPKQMVNETVSVVRKDGSSQQKRLIAVVQDFESATLYRV